MEKKKIKAHRIGTCGTFCSNCNKSDARAFNQYIKYCWFCGAEFKKDGESRRLGRIKRSY